MTSFSSAARLPVFPNRINALNPITAASVAIFPARVGLTWVEESTEEKHLSQTTTSKIGILRPKSPHVPIADMSTRLEQEDSDAGAGAGAPGRNGGSSTKITGSNNSSAPLSVSCTKNFDAMWFCYSPVHQMQQYYRCGEFDSCFEKWNALFDCLKLKTKKSSEVQEILEARQCAKPHIWTFRTVDEASSHWKKVFDSGATDCGAAPSS